ncbi:MAG TPA: NAD-dependent deacylase [Bacillota bacterium]|nr:NAD-dependent deacylase [Bacillota bacterium]
MLQKLAELITSSSHTIVFTGAGMSTESGLPDFRSAEGGLWAKFNPDELANIEALETNTEEFVNFYRHRLRDIEAYQPHKGHYILGEWEQNGWIHGIITQNVDGFHHDAHSKNVMELHGTFRSLYCHQCDKPQSREAFLNGDVYCSCGGPIRPGVVLFGEGLPQDVFMQAEKETSAADLFIVLGSSLTVTPANMFPLQAKQNRAQLVIVNRDDTPLDDFADYIIQDKSIKDVLTEVNQLLHT